VEKKRIAANDDCNLTGERYRENGVRASHYPTVPIGDICELFNGRAFKPEDWQRSDSGGLPIVRIQNLNTPDSEFNYYTGEVSDRNVINEGELLFSWSGSRGTSFGAHIWKGGKAVLNQHIFKVGFDESRATKMYLLHALNKAVTEVEENLHGGVGLVHITKGDLEKIRIPLPPLDVQKELVAEIEGYQKVIDGALAVIDNYKPTISCKARPLDVRELVLSALRKFKNRDSSLLQVCGNERSMTAKIACYLQGQFPAWDVDHEYNRDGDEPKRISDNSLIIPDIIVHRRGMSPNPNSRSNRLPSPASNYIVIEVKKGMYSEDDRRKLIDLVNTQDYQYAILLNLDSTKNPEEWINVVREPEAIVHVEEDRLKVPLGEAIDFVSGYAFKSIDMTEIPSGANFRRVVKIGNVGRDGHIDMADAQFHEYSEDLSRFVLHAGDIVMAMTGATVGKVAVVSEEGLLLNQRVGVLRAKTTVVQRYIFYLLCSTSFYNYCQRTAGGGAQGNIAPRAILEYPIPLPSLTTQQAIVDEIEAEQELVAATRELIARFEKKIQSTLARVWAEGK
jgi:restriction endonuclease S subunit